MGRDQGRGDARPRGADEPHGPEGGRGQRPLLLLLRTSPFAPGIADPPRAWKYQTLFTLELSVACGYQQAACGLDTTLCGARAIMSSLSYP